LRKTNRTSTNPSGYSSSTGGAASTPPSATNAGASSTGTAKSDQNKTGK